MWISHHILNIFIQFVLIIYLTDTLKVSNPIFANWTNNVNEKNKNEYDENQDFILPNETNLEGVPKFIKQPSSNYIYVYPDKPIEIECIAEPTNHLTIYCNKKHYYWEKNGMNFASNVQGYLDKKTKRARISILWNYSDIDSWSKENRDKKKAFRCVCHAWNTILYKKSRIPKKIQSNVAIIKKGYLKSTFKKIPQSTTVELGQRIILSCVPPDGNPIPVIGWLKNGLDLHQSNSNKNLIKIEEEHYKLVIDKARLSDSGNYSCKAITSVKVLLSPIAVVKVQNKTKNFWIPWADWEKCNKNCRKKRSRSCLPSFECFGIREQISDCTESECQESSLTLSIRETKEIAMYVGLFVAVGILVIVLTVIFFLIRRKAFSNSRNPLRYPLDLDDNNVSLESKSNLVKNQNKTLFYQPTDGNSTQQPHNIALIQHLSSSNTPVSSTISQATLQDLTNAKQSHQRRCNTNKTATPSPPSLPPPNCFSDSETTNNNYPYQPTKKLINPATTSHCCLHNPGIDLSTFNTSLSNTITCGDHQKFGQPFISNSSSVTNTSNRSKNTFSSTTSAVNDNLAESKESRDNSRPISALYNDISLNYEYPDADNDDPDDDIDSENVEIDNSNVISDDLSLLENERSNIAHFGNKGEQKDAETSTSFTCALLNGTVGGRLALPNSGINLTVTGNSFKVHPGNIVPNTQMYLSVVRNELYPPILNDSETLLTPIVLFGPDTTKISKPCVLTLPHSADLRQGNWMIRIVKSSIDPHATNNPQNWQVVATIGCEDDQTPIYTHLDPFQAFIMLDRPQKVCLIGQSYPGGKAIKRLRLGVFGQPMKQTVTKTNFNIRIYVFSDTKESFERITNQEMSIGGCLLDNTQPIMFNDCVGNNLLFCIEELSNGWCNQLTAKYQEIPFKDVWCTGSIADNLHCAFTFDNIDPGQYHNLMARITIYQSGFYNNRRTVTVRQDRTITNNNNYLKYYSHSGTNNKPNLQYDKVLLHSESNNNYLDPLNTIFRIHSHNRKKLCVLLDTINTRGNDWRNLYRQLGLNGYMNYFATKTSPTDALLTLWEARNRNESALLDLINCLKSINRLDCAAILEAEYSS